MTSAPDPRAPLSDWTADGLPVEPGRACVLSWGLFRPTEWLLLAYFTYVLLLAAPADAWRNLAPLGGAAVVFLLGWMESATGSLALGVIRDWLPTPLILVAYWAVDWHAPAVAARHFELAWIRFDRLLLDTWGGRAAIESLGPVVPFVLEMCYSLLYAVAPVSLGLLYLWRRRDRVDQFLFTLLMGTLATYTLLPHFPSLSPGAVFPGEDLPAYVTPFRALNLWLLGHYDIRTSVFPSGHVTLAFSAAFAMLLALPEKRRFGLGLLALATGVLLATIYGRYHYAVDGLAGLVVSLLSCGTGVLVHPALRRQWPGRGNR